MSTAALDPPIAAGPPPQTYEEAEARLSPTPPLRPVSG